MKITFPVFSFHFHHITEGFKNLLGSGRFSENRHIFGPDLQRGLHGRQRLSAEAYGHLQLDGRIGRESLGVLGIGGRQGRVLNRHGQTGKAELLRTAGYLHMGAVFILQPEKLIQPPVNVAGADAGVP